MQTGGCVSLRHPCVWFSFLTVFEVRCEEEVGPGISLHNIALLVISAPGDIASAQKHINIYTFAFLHIGKIISRSK